MALNMMKMECLEEAVVRPLEKECMEEAVLRPLELECMEQAVLRPLEKECMEEAVLRPVELDTGVRTASRHLRDRRCLMMVIRWTTRPARLDLLDSKVLDVFVFNSHVLDVFVFNSIACLRLLSF